MEKYFNCCILITVLVNNVINEVVKIDILKEAEEIIDNYIKKQSEFSCKIKRKIPITLYISVAAVCAVVSLAYFFWK